MHACPMDMCKLCTSLADEDDDVEGRTSKLAQLLQHQPGNISCVRARTLAVSAIDVLPSEARRRVWLVRVGQANAGWACWLQERA